MRKRVYISIVILFCLQSICSANNTPIEQNMGNGDQAEMSFEELMRRSEQGDMDASLQLWERYLLGHGIQKDRDRAYTYLQRAADQGHPRAQYEVGNLYDLAHEDYQQALIWYKKAAEQEYAPAQYNLGVSYATGKGGKQDAEIALMWYKKAAKNGSILAHYNIGTAYQLGQGAQQDSKIAVEWFEKAALQGYGLAQFNLGALYFNGGDLQKDDMTAYAWFTLALKYRAEPATEYAIQGINKIRTQLTEMQMIQAEDLYKRLEEEIEGNVQDIPKTQGIPTLYPQK